MRVFNSFLVVCVVLAAFATYQLKYESHALERRVAELRQAIKAERDSVAVLRAEWSHLNRPERVERLARKHLGLRPLKASQMLTARQYEALREPAPAEVAARLLGRPVRLASPRQTRLH